MSKRSNSKATKALKLARKNASKLCAEKKIYQTNTVDSPITNAGIINNLSNIGQGDTYITRDGDQLRCHSLLIRMKLAWNAAAPNAMVRFIIFYKLSDQNIIPSCRSATDTAILEGTAPYPLQPLDWRNRKLYKVIMDELFVGNPDSQDNLVLKRFIKLNHKIMYSSVDASGHRKGRIYTAMISDVLDNPPVITWSTRLKFYDN